MMRRRPVKHPKMRRHRRKEALELPMTTIEFTALVRQYQGLVYTVCRQLVQDGDIAQDLAQETFLAAWRAIDRCPPGCEKQWLARIAANKAKDHLRSAYARRVCVPGDESLEQAAAPPGTEPEQTVLNEAAAEALRQTVLALREPYRTPCRLCWLEGHSAAEAAQLCGRPEKTVSAQLFRAKKMLRAQLQGEEEPPGPARANHINKTNPPIEPQGQAGKGGTRCGQNETEPDGVV
jgi:RNA polymerase sigma-70 factor (ECF subfamily)